MDFHVDLGQLIIATLIAMVGYLLKLEISHFSKRLDKHETAIMNLVADVQRLIGISWATGQDQSRRWNDHPRNP